ncbi:MAG: DNA gyrase inhibitor YacG [Zetaproteobacteria bacterium]|nr:DNA gyrase inhibitor YacG [Zetaproteobacteria bacterium]
MTQKTTQFKCPLCKEQTSRNALYFPFCSERCRTLDLSRWADGSYSIAGDATSMPDDEANTH